MDLKIRNSVKKNLNKTHSSNSCRRSKTPILRDTSKKRLTKNQFQSKTKAQTPTLQRKNINELKAPELMIKAIYKGKRISIPIHKFDDKGLKETILPHIARFQKEILRNQDFKSSSIQNWKIFGNADILKDYYFQTNKPLNIFRGQILEVQPIWRKQSQGKLSLKDFEIIKCIGTGGFSRVFLVRLRATGKFYALKLMEKEGLLESGKECVVINQRDIMIDLQNPYILKLQFAFQTKHFVALGLQYCPGGQLFYYLRKTRKMNQEDARYCFVQILLGIQYLHSKKIIYRDIKPENIMIDMNGNLKIADFGLSRIGLRPNQLAYTYCGSPQYMAPQMLSKSGHSYSVDYYCLGALLYELVTGNPPFYSRNVQKIYYSIQNQEIDFPQHIDLSPEIKMLLESMLIKDPKRRLGSLGGIRQILGHPWVRKIKVTDITSKIIQTPVKVDLLNFNINEQEVNQCQKSFQEKLNDEDNDFESLFEDFYYCRNQAFNILDDALPSVKSDSTKQNKSLNSKIKHQISRQKYQKLPSKQKKNQKLNLKSQSKSYEQFEKIQINKVNKFKGPKQVNLIQKGRKRDNKQKSIFKKDKRLGSPKPNKKNTLKRIKSSAALLGHSNDIIKFSQN